eukprot:6872252-Prymnesium_polylepis.1
MSNASCRGWHAGRSAAAWDSIFPPARPSLPSAPAPPATTGLTRQLLLCAAREAPTPRPTARVQRRPPRPQKL